MIDVAFAILAGGNGTRIGGRKPHVQLANRPMIAHVADSLGRPLGVVGDTEAAEIVSATPLMDKAFDDAHGPLLGINAALAWGRSIAAGYVMITPCDCPLLPSDITERLLSEIRDEACACIRTTKGPEPLISLWSTELADSIDAILKSGKHPPLHHLLGNLGTAEVRLPEDRHALNVNTMEDLAEAEIMLTSLYRGD
ncbi:MAG: molybdenum cofactor guanylyltransferase [Pseudomonadota bacterium]